jgi:hypothetical protein
MNGENCVGDSLDRELHDAAEIARTTSEWSMHYGRLVISKPVWPGS